MHSMSGWTQGEIYSYVANNSSNRPFCRLVDYKLWRECSLLVEVDSSADKSVRTLQIADTKFGVFLEVVNLKSMNRGQIRWTGSQQISTNRILGGINLSVVRLSYIRLESPTNHQPMDQHLNGLTVMGRFSRRWRLSGLESKHLFSFRLQRNHHESETNILKQNVELSERFPILTFGS